jgi:membrane protease YdiL (CAAX protease family)
VRSATGHGDLAASVVLVAPVLLAYELGVVFARQVNGADAVTRALYTALGSPGACIGFDLAAALAFALWLIWTRRWATLRLDVVAPVVLEAAVYALTLGAVMALVVERLLGLSLTGSGVVAALGAGVHEEIVFRLAVMSLVVAGLRGGRPAVIAGIAVSAALFALAHHTTEPFAVRAFAARCVAGAAFAVIFWYRSLAHAVYAHVLYDLVVAVT